MALCAMHSTKPSHDFLFLTKRSSRMLDYYECAAGNIRERLAPIVAQMMEDSDGWHDSIRFNMPWPLPNVWAGVSVEDQERANERIPDLLATPAAIRWVSYEPALGPVNFHEIAMPEGWKMDSLSVGTYTAGVSGSAARVCSHPRLDWLVTGGESGSGARQFGVDWAKDALLQCQAAAVPFFMKQFGRRPSIGGTDVVWDPTMNGWTEGRFNDSHGGDWDEWPEAFKVRQFPEVSS
jgi:protein gp37